MATALQHRRGTTAQHATFTGQPGEVTVDTSKKTLVVHDGAVAGGTPLATAAEVATTNSNLAATNASIAALSPALVPVGSVIFHAMSTPPAGFIKANGAAVSRTTYAALFATLGTNYGAGNGSTTFTLPDLRGHFLRAIDDGRGVDPGRVFGSGQADELRSHSHFVGVAQVGGSGGATNTVLDTYNNIKSTTATGGAETRPVNTALLALIKY